MLLDDGQHGGMVIVELTYRLLGGQLLTHRREAAEIAREECDRDPFAGEGDLRPAPAPTLRHGRRHHSFENREAREGEHSLLRRIRGARPEPAGDHERHDRDHVRGSGEL